MTSPQTVEQTKPIPTKNKKCDFCEKERPFVLAQNDVSICLLCVKKAEQSGEMVPKGAVTCLKCCEYSAFKVKYNQASVLWAHTGLDVSDHSVYVAVQVTAPWDRVKEKAKIATCVKCNTDVPLSLFSLNKYIKV